MRFEDVVDFPGEREAYMIVRNELGLSEEDYLKLSYIERKELAEAYRVAKNLGINHQEKLRDGYIDTGMFNSVGVYDLAVATMIIKEKAGILSLARTRLGLKDSIEEFVLKGDRETNKILEKVREAYATDYDKVVEHLRPLVKPVDINTSNDDKTVVNKENKFEFK